MIDAPLQGTCRWCGHVCDHLIQARVIVQEVADEHRIPINDIYRHDRKAYIVAARACAIRRIRHETGLKLMAIGDLFGLDHSTVIHHLNGERATDAAAATNERDV